MGYYWHCLTVQRDISRNICFVATGTCKKAGREITQYVFPFMVVACAII